MEFYRHWKSVNVNKLNPNEGRTAEAKEQHNIELAKYYKFQLQVLRTRTVQAHAGTIQLLATSRLRS